MSEWRQRENTQQFEQLAPHYLEIFKGLSDNEALKFIFYSTIKHFEDFSDQIAFRYLMEDNDHDAERWSREDMLRGRQRYEIKEQKEREVHLAKRAAIPFQDLIEKTVLDDHIELRLRPDARQKLWDGFGRPFVDTDVYQIRDEEGNIKRVALFGGGPGATRYMITVDEDTGNLALGDSFHSISYDPDQDIFVGNLGAREYNLDEMGRYTSDITNYTATSKHGQAIERILSSEI